MSAVYGSAVFGGIGEQQAGANGAIAQQLPAHIEGTFALKGGRRSQRNRRSRRNKQSKRRRGGKSQKSKQSKQNKRRQQKGGN
jgi:hypothetical protein